MHPWLILLPVVAAVAGYLLSWSATRFLFSHHLQRKYLQQLTKVFAANLVTSFNVEKSGQSGEAYEKLLPVIEQHIDEFLRVKLVKELPYVGMLIGETTIVALKKIFMQELAILFPEIIKKYTANLLAGNDPAKLIEEKISTLPAKKLDDLFALPVKKFRLWGLILGLMIGLLQLLIFWMIG